jgi:hypothetical protein
MTFMTNHWLEQTFFEFVSLFAFFALFAVDWPIIFLNHSNFQAVLILFVGSVKSGQIRNLESARVSMVGQLKRFVVSSLPVLDWTK